MASRKSKHLSDRRKASATHVPDEEFFNSGLLKLLLLLFIDIYFMTWLSCMCACVHVCESTHEYTQEYFLLFELFLFEQTD